MKKLLSVLFACACAFQAEGNVQPKVTFVTPSIVRVQWAPEGELKGNETTVCIYEQENVKVKTKVQKGKTIYRTDELIVEMDNHTGALTFTDRKSGKLLLSEKSQNPRVHQLVAQEQVVYDENSARMVETANGKITQKDVLRRDTLSTSNRYLCNFLLSADEAVYGLGAHMEDYMNLRGKTMYLCQHNLKTMVPMLQSTSGYGLLFDAGCAMIYKDSTLTNGQSEMTLQMEAANEVDYYFMKGNSMDEVVAQYRYLTGGVPMLPRYMTGYVQSRERYVSQHDLLSTLNEFRRRHIPIDVIVQDWNYWPQGWGYAKMDRRHYPDPKGMADSVHKQHAHLMISVWPNPQNCPEEELFRKENLMLEHSIYNAYSEKGRKMYWDIINEEFFSQGFDAWWTDCSEPVDADWGWRANYGWDNHKERWELNTKMLSEVSGAERSQLFSLFHSRGIYEHQRATTDEKRVVNLTRSGYAGQQRYATINWNGDTHASWKSFKRQIPAGLNYMATGNPYWTVDVGCFFTRKDGRWFWNGDYPQGNADPAFREFYTRMMQWATFLPVLRSHGTDTQREPWFFGEPGALYYDAILDMINLRYTLTPYIYSLAAQQTFDNYSMARLLAFDFPNDKEAHDIKDEYMFGRILVCPVTDAGATSRRVYLPQASQEAPSAWIDFWTGKSYDGGQWIEASAPLNRLPLFVRAGSLITTTEVAEYSAAQKGKPITINIYPGADATFTLYEDEGDGYDYEKGEYANIQLQWDESRRTLHIGNCEGQYQGMPTTRTFIVHTPWNDQQVEYQGKKLKIKL